MRIVATIEARMASTRLPGKVMLQVLDQTMLERLVYRLQSVKDLDDIVIATTTNEKDQVLVEHARNLGVSYYCGSEENVLDRVINASLRSRADAVVEITADCPILDPEIVQQMIYMYRKNSCHYLSNCHIRSYPMGMDVQVIDLESLIHSSHQTHALLDQEHVSLYMRNHPEIYKQIHLIAPNSLYAPNLALTLDEPKDFQMLSRIIERLEPADKLFGCRDTLDFLKQNPQIAMWNQDVIRKGDT